MVLNVEAGSASHGGSKTNVSSGGDHFANGRNSDTENEIFSDQDLFDKVFNDNWMSEFIVTIKSNPKTQKDIELIVNKYSNESYGI